MARARRPQSSGGWRRGASPPTSEGLVTTSRESRGSRTVRIGLTGPIGCGKSTVARWLAARGAVVVDADAVARDVTAPGEPATDKVLARFGNAYRAADGGLD